MLIAWEGEAVAHSPVEGSTSPVESSTPSLDSISGVAFGQQGTHSSWMFQGCLVGQEGKAYRTHMMGMKGTERGLEWDALLVGEADGIWKPELWKAEPQNHQLDWMLMDWWRMQCLYQVGVARLQQGLHAGGCLDERSAAPVEVTSIGEDQLALPWNTYDRLSSWR